jgi:hypothetical protein
MSIRVEAANNHPHKAHMHKGFIRLGILLTALWVVGVCAVFMSEFFGQNVFCQFDTLAATSAACEHALWHWAPAGSSSSIFTTDLASGAKQIFVPNLWQVSGLAFGIPVLGWLLGMSINWVVNGFKSHL